MKILFCLFLLPCVFGAYTICSDNTACPEGTKCCTTYDDKIRCCDVNNPDSIFVKTTRPFKVVPEAPLHAYVNATQSIARYGSCIEGINCPGTCCEDNCCDDHKLATCCDGGCCGFMYHCCSGYTQYIVMKRWCCVKGMKCGDADGTRCLDKGAFLTPHIAVIFITVSIRMWLLKVIV